MVYFRNFISGVLLIIGIFSLISSASTSEIYPSKIVTDFHKVLLWSMKNSQILNTKERYKKIAPQIKQSFNFALMAQISVGSYWRKASKKQAKALVSAFTHFSISNFASQFDGYTGQSFITLGEKRGPQKTILIKTQIISPGSKPIEITYVTQKIKQKWRIIDILLGSGISELAIRKSEYRQILKNNGLDKLIETLNRKAEKLINQDN